MDSIDTARRLPKRGQKYEGEKKWFCWIIESRRKMTELYLQRRFWRCKANGLQDNYEPDRIFGQS